MHKLALSSQSYLNPVSVTHQGKALYFVSKQNTVTSRFEFFYNVLSPMPASISDSLDWDGFQLLNFPSDNSLAGFNMLRTREKIDFDGFFTAVSDQKYIYLFRSNCNRIYVSRFVLVEIANPNVSGEKINQLQPAWEVRYKRSQKPDTPANDSDTQSFINMDNLPFQEPQYILPLGGDSASFNMNDGKFTVNLTPTNQEGTMRWQFFAVNDSRKTICTYSFDRTSDGWFSFDSDQYDALLQVIKPDHEISLYSMTGAVKTDLNVIGAPSSVVYSRQEPVVIDGSGQVKMRNSYRLKLMVQVNDSASKSYLSSLDFAVASNGTLACIAPGANALNLSYEAGKIKPVDYSLAFNNASVEIPDGLILGNSFVQQLWVYPEDKSLRKGYLLSNFKEVNPNNLPPSLWIENQTKVGFGFGTGTAFLSGSTLNGVLTLNTWNNIIAVFDGKNYRIYINGELVPVNDSVFNGKTPAKSSLNTIGLSGPTKNEEYFIGMVDEVRIWNNASSLFEALNNLYKDISKVDAAKMAFLAAYWRLDEGSGTKVSNLSKTGATLDGDLYGPIWTSNSAPLISDQVEQVYIDGDTMLTLNVGVVDPTDQIPTFSHFGNIKAGTRPFLFDSADGLVHLYYEGDDSNFYVAHFDSAATRAQYSIPWEALTNIPVSNQSGNLNFIARRQGDVMNRAEIIITKESNPYLCSVSINDKRGTTELFKGVPLRVKSLIEVVSGSAYDQPGQLSISGQESTFYDYTGQRNIGYQSYGDPKMYSQLNFISNFITNPVLNKVDTTVKGNVAEAIFHFSVGSGSNNFVKTFKNLPAESAQFVNTLRGLNQNYDYNALTNQQASDSGSYSLSTSISNLLVLIPDNSITNVNITIADATDKSNLNCDLTISLKQGVTTISANWKNISRKESDFVATIRNSGSGAQQQIAKIIYLLERNTNATVLNGIVTSPAGLLSVSSLFTVLMQGENSLIQSFNCTLGKVQGTNVNGSPAELLNGSQLFFPASTISSNNGFPEVVSLNGLPSIKATQTVAGLDGGWIAESPRKAIHVPLNGGLKVQLDAKYKAPLNLKGDLTIEGWLNVESQFKMGQKLKPLMPDFPRLVHANPVNDPDGSRYMLGVTPSYALQFLSKAVVEATDDGQAHEYKLFTEDKYTIQFYVKANLSSFVNPNFVYRRTEKALVSSDSLSIVNDGTLTWSCVAGDGSTYSKGLDIKLESEKWTLLTITRSGTTFKFFLNGIAAGELINVAGSAYQSNKIVLGGNDSIVCLEMEMNQFTIWKRAMEQSEIVSRNLQMLPADAEGLQLLWAMNTYNKNKIVENTAQATNAFYDVSLKGFAFWDFPGVFYQVFAASRDLAMVTDRALIPENSWNHIACTYSMNYGINTGGATKIFANCGNSRSFDVTSSISVEAWIYQSQLTPGMKQVIFSKYGKNSSEQSYEFGLDAFNHPYFDVRIDGQTSLLERDRHFTITGTSPISLKQAAFIGMAAQIRDKKVGDKVMYYLEMNCVVNGVAMPSFVSKDFEESIVFSSSSTNVNIGRTKPDGDIADFAFFNGTISNLAFWNEGLSVQSMIQHFRTRIPLKGLPGLVSYWTFQEQVGRVAFDTQNDNNALLSDSNAWTIYPFSATLNIFVNGVQLPVHEVPFTELGGYGAEQVRFGNMLDSNGAIVNTFKGKIDEIRLWNQKRTAEQISDNIYSSITGTEEGLSAYWQFDVGSGMVVVDKTGQGNDAIFDAVIPTDLPTWVESDAPVSDEAPPVLNALGGVITAFSKKIHGGPAVMEYADSQYDAYGKLFSVIKRCYIYSNQSNVLEQLTGFKIGDLQQVYIGQVQSEPTVLGFIEGAPPVPSENLTRPFYEDPISSYLEYSGISSVSLTQDKNMTVKYSADREDGRQIAFGIKGGLEFESTANQVIGIAPVQSVIQVVKMAGSVGIAFELSKKDSDKTEKAVSSKLTSSIENSFTSGGDWEAPGPDGNYYLKSQERRFIPGNDGIALVKSATADLYALFLKNKGTLVSFSIVPNPDIPVDINYIYFPISPEYIKNGSLDGRVGMQDDPDAQGTSYFKPIEAYSIKKRIEAENNRLGAYFSQFEVAKRANANNSSISDVIDDNVIYDWNADSFKKDIVSTSIWTAAGGLYTENNGNASILQETYTGSYNFNWNLGAYGSFMLALPFGGFKVEANVMGGTNWTINVVKDKESEAQIGLNVTTAPERYLKKYLGENAKTPFTSKPEPGKVDAYRFMSFYLAPDKRNVDDLFTKVIDQNWLNNSGDSQAKALLQAKAKPNNGAWRVMYRVTYVSRVPPEFQSFPNESQAPPLAEPSNLEGNNLLITMIKSKLGVGPKSPELIGKAVREIITVDMKTIIPWWAQFLSDASIYNSEENKILTALIADTIDYMVQYYETL